MSKKIQNYLIKLCTFKSVTKLDLAYTFSNSLRHTNVSEQEKTGGIKRHLFSYSFYLSGDGSMYVTKQELKGTVSLEGYFLKV